MEQITNECSEASNGKELVRNYLKSINLITKEPIDRAIKHLRLDDYQVILSGNRMGLILLAEHVVSIALQSEDHRTHLNDENFFENEGMELVIEHIKE